MKKSNNHNKTEVTSDKNGCITDILFNGDGALLYDPSKNKVQIQDLENRFPNNVYRVTTAGTIFKKKKKKIKNKEK